MRGVPKWTPPTAGSTAESSSTEHPEHIGATPPERDIAMGPSYEGDPANGDGDSTTAVASPSATKSEVAREGETPGLTLATTTPSTTPTPENSNPASEESHYTDSNGTSTSHTVFSEPNYGKRQFGQVNCQGVADSRFQPDQPFRMPSGTQDRVDIQDVSNTFDFRRPTSSTAATGGSASSHDQGSSSTPSAEAAEPTSRTRSDSTTTTTTSETDTPILTPTSTTRSTTPTKKDTLLPLSTTLTVTPRSTHTFPALTTVAFKPAR